MRGAEQSVLLMTSVPADCDTVHYNGGHWQGIIVSCTLSTVGVGSTFILS